MPVSEAETTTGSPTGASALAVVGEGVLREPVTALVGKSTGKHGFPHQIGWGFL